MILIGTRICDTVLLKNTQVIIIELNDDKCVTSTYCVVISLTRFHFGIIFVQLFKKNLIQSKTHYLERICHHFIEDTQGD